MRNALIYLVTFLAIQLGATSTVQQMFKLLGDGHTPTGTVLIVALAMSNVVALAVFLLTRWATVSRDYVRSRQWGVLAWCVVAAAGFVIPSLGLQELMPDMPDLLESDFKEMMKSQWGYLTVALLVPVVEELVFRGAILRSLMEQWAARPGKAIILSAVIFSFCHDNPAQMPHAFLVGLLLGWMYWRTGSVVPGVAYHWTNNTIAFILCNAMPNPDASLLEIFKGSWLHVALAVVFSLCIFLPSVYQLNIRMRRVNDD